ncbi:aminomethyltransferase [Syntrophus gentianae]|uniref:Aminomethyltransferase n=1 Tax=Syntrophus gentianae TaxID=43775 RepID=A0A1H7Y2D2_9BACT|nr:aminomethyltransferase family protein [Syntrophus gentianae]SEM40024.1 aminomethyltransferase [Syntrophus gentianae]
METQAKKTLLHDWHLAHGARMADFAGYEMPLWYSSGVKNEHLAVLTHAGMFDTSHMAVVMLRGKGGFDLLQLCFTRDLRACVGKDRTPLIPSRCIYGAFLDPKGGVIDDAVVCQLAPEHYMIVVNAGMGGIIAQHLRDHRENREVEIEDLSHRVGKLDIQGPLSARVLKKVLAEPEKAFEQLRFFSFKGHFDAASPLADAVRLTDGTPILLSRSGYTGEFGFEIYVAPEHFVSAWETIFEAGEDLGSIPCGLGARDSLRAGAMLPLSHQDIGPWPFVHHPWPFALPFNDDGSAFTKEFVGSEALLRIESPEFTFAFVGDDLRKVSTEESAFVLDSAGQEIGTVLTCVTDIGIGRREGRIYSIASPDKPENFDPRGLSCGFVKVKVRLWAGDRVELKDRRRRLQATIVNGIRPDLTAHRPIREMI